MLPLATGASISALFILGVLPPGSAQLEGERRTTASALPQPEPVTTSSQVPAPVSTTPTTAASPTASRTVTKAPKATASPTVRVESAPAFAHSPVTSPGIRAAARYATSRGYQAGVAVVDTRTGKLWAAGNYDGRFAAESVVKVFIATRLLVSGQLTGDTADTAYRMITRSDDGAADSLYGLAGGDEVVDWIAEHYGIPNLGSPPTQAGWWSNTHISAIGMVRFYAKVKADPVVWPWLSDAMHHATEYGSDGTYQFFGLKQADPRAAIKQGWGQDDDDWSNSSDFNSTGFVNSDRFAVAILVKGPPYEYNWGVPNMVTSVAKALMPGGVMRP
jgi:hypothetical protein